jgi:hypothetical protein
MSQAILPSAADGFVLVPLNVLPFPSTDALADAVRMYERAIAEVRAVLRPAITDRVLVGAWN